MDNQTDNIKSLGGNLWKTAEADERAAELIVQKYNLPYIVARILTLRGVSVDEVAGFIDPKIQNLMPNPFVLKDMEKAAKRITEAIVKQQKVAVIGDYDVDGATSSSVLKLFLESVGCMPEIHIPERDEGYGPSTQAVDDFKAQGAELLITVGRPHSMFWNMPQSREWTLLSLTITKRKFGCPKFLRWLTPSVWMKTTLILICVTWRPSELFL